LLFAFLAFLYLPTRLIVAAVPEWRPIQWSLGIEVIGLTLYVIYVGMGRGWLRQLAFPICFFFVAIPWPSPIENPIIQHLTRASAAIVIELLGWVGVPALAHGNVIEVSTGMVGIDEACSGIRSFQSSLMISLFFGEFYRLSHWRRGLLVPMGFVFSVAFNVCRMSLLTLVAAKKGVAAISQYHDEAGITIAILCTLALWGVAILLRSPKSKVQSPKLEAQESATADHKTMDNGPSVVGGPVVGSPVVGSPSPVVGGPVVSGRPSAPWSLVLLGDGPLKSDLCHLISDLGLQHSVLLPGFKQYPDLPAYYGLASAFIHASTTEQWGLVVNEAMASGLPVLVSNRCGCAQDLVREGVNGFTFDPYNVEEMANVMLRLTETPKHRLTEMGDASRQLISAWGPERFARGLHDAAETALKNPPPIATVYDRLLLMALIYK